MDSGIINSNTLLQLGVGFAVIYVVLRLVLNFLEPLIAKVLGSRVDTISRVWTEDVDQIKSEIMKVKQQVDDLHEWHNARTPDGGFRWYVPSTLEKAIEALAVNILKQADILREIANFQRVTRKQIERMERRAEKETR